MLAPVVHILPLTTIRRERILPVSGRVVVRMDQKVSPVDVVAEANLGEKHILLDVARLLGIAATRADELIVCKAGERVTSNQLIAQSQGLVPHNVHAPCDGRVVAVGDGRVLLEVGNRVFELRAGIPGTITRLVPERGVEITANGSLIQGVWGNDRVDIGLMLPAYQMSSAGHELDAGHLEVSQRGAILLAGHCSDPQALRTAAELPLRGLILGSITPELMPVAAQMRYPIIVTDAIGKYPMNRIAYKLLSTNINREVALNGTPVNLHTGSRPEIIIPLPVSHEQPMLHESVVLTRGQQVRMCRAPNMHEVGTLSDLLPGLTDFPSGLHLPAAEVLLENNQKVTVPLVNIEVLG